MLRTSSAVLAFLIFAQPVYGQTSSTNCQVFGNSASCQTRTQPTAPGIRWDQMPGPRNTATESLQQGMALGSQAAQSRAERKRIEAETELYRAQAEAVRRGTQSAPIVEAAPDYVARWRTAVGPRAHLYPDLVEKITDPLLPLSQSMIELLSSSPLAADLSYYLATHRTESAAIAGMGLLDQARAIDRIEHELKARMTDKATPEK